MSKKELLEEELDLTDYSKAIITSLDLNHFIKLFYLKQT